MAAGFIPPPGGKHGPCPIECHHVDCAETRKRAASTCRICNEPIGYERMYYTDPKGSKLPETLVHAACLEDEISAEA